MTSCPSGEDMTGRGTGGHGDMGQTTEIDEQFKGEDG
jgi:hypothetical protein